MSNTNREDKTMTIRELSNELNTSTSEWNNAARPVLDEYTETSVAEIEAFVAIARKKRDDAQRLVEMLFDLEIEIAQNATDAEASMV
jgi:hypothetical protein